MRISRIAPWILSTVLAITSCSLYSSLKTAGITAEITTRRIFSEMEIKTNERLAEIESKKTAEGIEALLDTGMRTGAKGAKALYARAEGQDLKLIALDKSITTLKHDSQRGIWYDPEIEAKYGREEVGRSYDLFYGPGLNSTTRPAESKKE